MSLINQDNKNKKKLNLIEMDKLYKKCRYIAKIKSKNYGTKNLKLFNGLSILVRMNDKIARLNTCIENKKIFDFSRSKKYFEKKETLLDTIFDLINYSFYLLLYLDNKLEI